MKLSRPSTALLALIVCTSSMAEENAIKEGAKEIGHAVGTAAREVGDGAKKAAKEIGKAATVAARETGHAFRDGAKEAKQVVTADTQKDKPAKPKK